MVILNPMALSVPQNLNFVLNLENSHHTNTFDLPLSQTYIPYPREGDFTEVNYF